jgi:hypothetical protein
MQFLYHLKQEKEKVNEAAHHHYQVFGNGGQPQMYPHKSPMYSINNLTTFEGQTDMTLPGMMSESQMQSNATLIAKRKLYFSAGELCDKKTKISKNFQNFSNLI